MKPLSAKKKKMAPYKEKWKIKNQPNKLLDKLQKRESEKLLFITSLKNVYVEIVKNAWKILLISFKYFQLIRMFHKLQQRVGVFGEKVIYEFIAGKNDKFIYYYGRRIHKIR